MYRRYLKNQKKHHDYESHILTDTRACFIDSININFRFKGSGVIHTTLSKNMGVTGDIIICEYYY